MDSTANDSDDYIRIGNDCKFTNLYNEYCQFTENDDKVKKANEFQSRIEFSNDSGDIVNGKSIIGLMCLAAEKGHKTLF